MQIYVDTKRRCLIATNAYIIKEIPANMEFDGESPDLLTTYIDPKNIKGMLGKNTVDVYNNQTLSYLIELLRQSIGCNNDSNDKGNITNVKDDKSIDIYRINKILSSVFFSSQMVKIEKIDSIKFLPSDFGYIIEVKDNHKELYYVNLDEDGYLGTVREHSSDGKIIFMPMDD